MKKPKKLSVKNTSTFNEFYLDKNEEDYSILDSVFKMDDDETFITNTLTSMGLKRKDRL